MRRDQPKIFREINYPISFYKMSEFTLRSKIFLKKRNISINEKRSTKNLIISLIIISNSIQKDHFRQHLKKYIILHLI
ncbi:hypothetical protein CWI36_2244p0010 [Hamiltosporidium magnivora]|uniref:Uncharacterized protein n=1 Tax=Hamiltosporidium magnivora TaxID=148818 RepID=A0A4Q9KV76_9MICR|nr:hypothetical protein CWI36_2244p0010 [Hamiltosporidium magnivora]